MIPSLISLNAPAPPGIPGCSGKARICVAVAAISSAKIRPKWRRGCGWAEQRDMHYLPILPIRNALDRGPVGQANRLPGHPPDRRRQWSISPFEPSM
jgi:hypothetical protein